MTTRAKTSRLFVERNTFIVSGLKAPWRIESVPNGRLRLIEVHHVTIIDRLATSLNRRDERANQELAEEIAERNDRAAVRDLVDNLAGRNRAIQSDCIKVLYEIGEREPALIAPYHKVFAGLLESRNNRMVWGAMTALDTIATVEPQSVFSYLEKIIEVANAGSVISRDHAVGILIKLSAARKFSTKCFPLFLDQLRTCPDNQFAMYVEQGSDLFTSGVSEDFVSILRARIDLLPRESQKKRVAKVLRRVTRRDSK